MVPGFETAEELSAALPGGEAPPPQPAINTIKKSIRFFSLFPYSQVIYSIFNSLSYEVKFVSYPSICEIDNLNHIIKIEAV